MFVNKQKNIYIRNMGMNKWKEGELLKSLSPVWVVPERMLLKFNVDHIWEVEQTVSRETQVLRKEQG